jgi:hypothetical protein
MPIKPENRARYPADWPAISLAAKVRAGWKCQHPQCMARQYAVGHWQLCRELGGHASYWLWVPTHGNGPHDAAGQGLGWPDLQRWAFAEARQFAAESFDANPLLPKPIVIVLTVAHLNHQPEDCRPENLAAMCQRHHLAYDLQHHRQTAYATRKRVARTADLFEEM